MPIRITCINKSGGYHQDPHNAIEHLGWTEDGTGKTGKSSRLDIYNWIKNQTGEAYVTDRLGNRASVGTRENANGTKFVQTYADKVWTDNLLSLPECQ
jgi:hypothetical protein